MTFRSLRSIATYSVAIVILTTVSVAQTFTTLADFNGTDGASPRGALTQGLDGNLYGAAYNGGKGGICFQDQGCGTIYKATTSGAITLLHQFSGNQGAHPPAAPVLGSDGNFYGVTYRGGFYTNGAFFRMTPDGTVNTLYNFTIPGGAHPAGKLTLAVDGNFYGSTEGGGLFSDGTIFRLSSTGVHKRLYNFCAQSGCPDGAGPADGLVQAGDGTFYGVTPTNGANNSGTIFKITPAGVFTTLYNFCAQTACFDGAIPNVTLVEGPDGNLYGTTVQGGTFNSGTVFRITRRGAYTVLHNFCSLQPGCRDGGNPETGLVLGSDLNLYGTTTASAANLRGTIFRINNAQKQFEVVYSFQTSDGEFPSQLLQATDGNFYGTMQLAGPHNAGSLFSLSTGLGAFVKSVEPGGKVGSTVHIYGQGLSATADVQFNGTSASSFTVVSDTEVTAVVPSGATTGVIQVLVAPSTAYSTVTNFRVLP